MVILHVRGKMKDGDEPAGQMFHNDMNTDNFLVVYISQTTSLYRTGGKESTQTWMRILPIPTRTNRVDGRPPPRRAEQCVKRTEGTALVRTRGMNHTETKEQSTSASRCLQAGSKCKAGEGMSTGKGRAGWPTCDEKRYKQIPAIKLLTPSASHI